MATWMQAKQLKLVKQHAARPRAVYPAHNQAGEYRNTFGTVPRVMKAKEAKPVVLVAADYARPKPGTKAMQAACVKAGSIQLIRNGVVIG